MKPLHLLLPLAATAALAACSSNPAATAARSSAPVAFVDPTGVRYAPVTETEAQTLAEIPGGRSSWTSMNYASAFNPAAFDATRQNSQTVAPGLVRQGTSVPMTSGGGTSDSGSGGSGGAAAGASGASGAGGGSGSGSGGGNR
jgi:hypothetical protein